MTDEWRALFYAVAFALFVLGALINEVGSITRPTWQTLVAAGLAVWVAVPGYDAIKAL